MPSVRCARTSDCIGVEDDAVESGTDAALAACSVAGARNGAVPASSPVLRAGADIGSATALAFEGPPSSLGSGACGSSMDEVGSPDDGRDDEGAATGAGCFASVVCSPCSCETAPGALLSLSAAAD